MRVAIGFSAEGIRRISQVHLHPGAVVAGSLRVAHVGRHREVAPIGADGREHVAPLGADAHLAIDGAGGGYVSRGHARERMLGTAARVELHHVGPQDRHLHRGLARDAGAAGPIGSRGVPPCPGVGTRGLGVASADEAHALSIKASVLFPRRLRVDPPREAIRPPKKIGRKRFDGEIPVGMETHRVDLRDVLLLPRVEATVVGEADRIEQGEISMQPRTPAVRFGVPPQPASSEIEVHPLPGAPVVVGKPERDATVAAGDSWTWASRVRRATWLDPHHQGAPQIRRDCRRKGRPTQVGQEGIEREVCAWRIRLSDVSGPDRVVGEVHENDVVPGRIDGVIGAANFLVRDDHPAGPGPRRARPTRHDRHGREAAAQASAKTPLEPTACGQEVEHGPPSRQAFCPRPAKPCTSPSAMSGRNPGSI